MTDRLQLPPKPPLLRDLTEAEYAALTNRVPLTWTHPDLCHTCSGEKWFRWRDASGQVAEYDCNCFDQYEMHVYFMHCGIGMNYQTLGWADFIDPDPKIVEAANDYATNAKSFLNKGLGMVVSGPRGTGKSMVAYLLLKHLLAEGHTGYALTFSTMLQLAKRGFDSREQEQWFDRQVKHSRVLLIDDLGREFTRDRYVEGSNLGGDTRPGAWKESFLEDTIRTRVSSGMPTFVTTNFTPDEIAQGYGGHTISLLMESSIILEVGGANMRQEVNARKMEETRQGLSRPVVVG